MKMVKTDHESKMFAGLCYGTILEVQPLKAHTAYYQLDLLVYSRSLLMFTIFAVIMK